jgi:hypothetical protein
MGGGSSGEPGKDANKTTNQTALAQKNILDHLLLLGVESQWAPVALRCMALRCIGNLVLRNPQNLDSLASKQVGEDPHVQPALSAIFSIILRTSLAQEFVAADYVFKCFCEVFFHSRIFFCFNNNILLQKCFWINLRRLLNINALWVAKWKWE